MNEGQKMVLRAFGYGDHVDRVEQGLCPFCAQKVDPDSFKDNLSKKEFEISGMCQTCQDEFFTVDEAIETANGTCKRPKFLSEKDGDGQ